MYEHNKQWGKNKQTNKQTKQIHGVRIGSSLQQLPTANIHSITLWEKWVMIILPASSDGSFWECLLWFQCSQYWDLSFFAPLEEVSTLPVDLEIFNFKPRRQLKDTTAFLGLGRCKSQGLLVLFPWHVPHLSGACNIVSCSGVTIESGYSPMDAWGQLFSFLSFFRAQQLMMVSNDVQSLSPFQLFTAPWTAACQTSLPFTVSWSLLKLMSIESVMPHNHLILCCPLLLLASIFPRISVFSNESTFCIRWSKYWRFSFNINPSNEYWGLISFRIDWFHLLVVQGTSKSLPQNHSLKTLILWSSALFMVQLSYPYMENGKTKTNKQTKTHSFD